MYMMKRRGVRGGVVNAYFFIIKISLGIINRSSSGLNSSLFPPLGGGVGFFLSIDVDNIVCLGFKLLFVG